MTGSARSPSCISAISGGSFSLPIVFIHRAIVPGPIFTLRRSSFSESPDEHERQSRPRAPGTASHCRSRRRPPRLGVHIGLIPHPAPVHVASAPRLAAHARLTVFVAIVALHSRPPGRDGQLLLPTLSSKGRACSTAYGLGGLDSRPSTFQDTKNEEFDHERDTSIGQARSAPRKPMATAYSG